MGLETLALAAIAGGTGLSAYSTIQGGKEQAEAGKLQQQQFNAEAEATLLASQDEAMMLEKKGRADIASGIATTSAFGGLVGSNLVLLAEKARNYAIDKSMILQNASVKAGSLRQQGRLARYGGQLNRRNARMRATADIAGTAGKLYLMTNYPQPKEIT